MSQKKKKKKLIQGKVGNMASLIWFNKLTIKNKNKKKKKNIKNKQFSRAT